MALHHELPIYKVSYDLFNLAVDLTSHLPRNLKRHVGDAVLGGCVEVLKSTFRANVARDKVEHIEALLEELEVVNLWLRMLKDKKCISLAQYARAVELTASIGRQAGGWKKASAASPVSGPSRRS